MRALGDSVEEEWNKVFSLVILFFWRREPVTRGTMEQGIGVHQRGLREDWIFRGKRRGMMIFGAGFFEQRGNGEPERRKR